MVQTEDPWESSKGSKGVLHSPIWTEILQEALEAFYQMPSLFSTALNSFSPSFLSREHCHFVKRITRMHICL